MAHRDLEVIRAEMLQARREWDKGGKFAPFSALVSELQAARMELEPWLFTEKSCGELYDEEQRRLNPANEQLDMFAA